MKERVTIADIARLSGVSESTVSRIINNKGKYTEETREAVRRAAETLHYEKSSRTDFRRGISSPLVGVVVPSVGDEFFGSFAQKIALELTARGYIPVICPTGEKQEKEALSCDMLAGIGAAGIVYVLRETDIQPSCADIPSVFIGSAPEDAKGDCILFDIVDGGKKATEELISAGCRRIVYLASDRHRRRHMGRYLGYQQALWEHRIEIDPELVFTIGTEEFPSVREVLQTLHDKGIIYDGIFANKLLTAVDCYSWMKENDSTGEAKVKVISFEDGMLAEFSEGGITAVNLDISDISRTAVTMLAERLEKPGKEKQVIRAAYGMVRRNST